MKKVFLIHGFNGSPNGGWRPWLMGKLARMDIYACSLPMPSPEAPQKGEWVQTIAEAVGSPNKDTFLVGHSLGVPAILRYLEVLQEGEKIGGVVLVSGPFTHISKDGYDNVNNFLKGGFDFEKIKTACDYFVVVHGTDDPMVPFSDAEIFSSSLGCELLPVQNGKHLNGSAGFYEVPEILEAASKMVS